MALAVLVAAVVGLLALQPVTASGAAAPPESTTTTTLPPPAKAELLADLNTGRVLVSQNVHALMPPASLTKMLTALIAIDWLPSNAIVVGTPAAANVYPDKVGIQAGQKWPFTVVLHALLIDSANDAAYALAQRVSKTLPAFGPVMAYAAAQMGMDDHPVFHDPAGLDGTEGVAGGNRMSAWDVAIAARDLLHNPTLAGIVAMKTYSFTGPGNIVYDLTSKNLAFLDDYAGAIGVKTGFTDPAGVCIAAAAERNGRTLLAVVLNGQSPNQTAEDLLNRGFATPAKAEPATDPQLPAVHEPEPPPPLPPTTTTIALYNPGGPAVAKEPVAALASGGPASSGPFSRSVPWDAADAAVVLVAMLLVIRQVARSRRRPAGAHSRHGHGRR